MFLVKEHSENLFPPYRCCSCFRVHAFLCVMGLLFYRWVQLRAEKELGVRIPIDRLARSLSGIRVAAVTDMKGKGGRFVLEKVRDERRELVSVLKVACRVPNQGKCAPQRF